jgi:hypothetical protein
MTNVEIEELIKDTFDRILHLHEVKAAEYSKDSDVLSNFRRNGADMGLPMEVIWRVYAGKHWDALSQYVRDIGNGTRRVLSEPIESRIDDLIVYLCLFKAMLRERSCRTESSGASSENNGHPSPGPRGKF